VPIYGARKSYSLDAARRHGRVGATDDGMMEEE